MIETRPSMLFVSQRDPHHLSRAAEIARAGFKVVVTPPAKVAGRVFVALSFDAIVIDHDLDEGTLALMRRIAAINRDTLRIVIGGSPADAQELRESGILHHHLTSLDIETLGSLLRAKLEEDDAPQPGRPKAGHEVG
jgi:hypothetical protein